MIESKSSYLYTVRRRCGSETLLLTYIIHRASMIGLPRNERTAGEYFFLQDNQIKTNMLHGIKNILFLPNKINEWLIEINNTR